MKKQLIILIIGFIIFDNSIPLQAIQQPAVDEVEMMLKKIEGNLKMASQVTSVAKSAGDKFVSNKVQEKAELKQAVSDAQAQVSELKKQNETFATRMVEAGIDTSGNVEDVNYSGPVWDDYQVYLKNGGTSDFEYFRLYRK